MQHTFFIIFAILTVNTSSCLAFSASEDDIYIDLIKLENDGDLPPYIEDAKPSEPQTENHYKQTNQLTHIQAVREFENDVTVAKNRLPKPENIKTWNDIVKSVASGNPSIFDVNQIKILTEKNDLKATELLAWMYAKGVGVKKNLKSSWFLYMKSDALGVENAKENAELIYKSMPQTQKNELTRF